MYQPNDQENDYFQVGMNQQIHVPEAMQDYRNQPSPNHVSV